MPYGYRLTDAGPHPNRRLVRHGVQLQRFDTDPTAAPIVQWMFAMRLQEMSLAGITRALNDKAIPCPSAEDPESNPHRTGAAWTLGTVREILVNPVYTGRMAGTAAAPTAISPTQATPGSGGSRSGGATPRTSG